MLTYGDSTLTKALAEVDTLKQDLAIEKMAKVSAQADLEAALNKKPDTSEADALRKELQELKVQHEAAQQELVAEKAAKASAQGMSN